jgi:hypothetical protein
MPATRTDTSLFSAQTTGATSSAVDCSADYLREAYVSIVQVGTATTAASFYFLYSTDGTNYNYQSQTWSAGLAAATYNWQIQLPAGCKSVKMVFTAQTGGTSSTCTADLNEVTAV